MLAARAQKPLGMILCYKITLSKKKKMQVKFSDEENTYFARFFVEFCPSRANNFCKDFAFRAGVRITYFARIF